MHIAPGIHCHLGHAHAPWPPPPTVKYSILHTHTHIRTRMHFSFFFATCNHGKDDRPEHGAEILIAFLQKLVWRDLVPLLRMCQELQQPLDCTSINGEKGWLESTVWGCVCLWTLILPAEADLTTMSGFLHCSWGSESNKRKREIEKWETPHSWRSSVTQNSLCSC